MKLIVIERFRDLKTKSEEFPQGKDREIDEIFDVDDKRAKELLDKGWVKKADDIGNDKKNKQKKDDSIKENHDDEEKNIENANSNIDNSQENKNDDDKDIEKK